MEKIGWVKTSEQLPCDTSYSNPRITFDGKYWYVSVGIETETEEVELSGEVIGIDVGIKDLAICSNGMKFKNINKTKAMKKREKRLKRLQRQVSRQYEKNKEENKENSKKNSKENKEKGSHKFVKTNNIVKTEKKIRLLNRRITNVRLNHIHQATNAIVKTKPSMVVVETLNIKGLMKNKKVSKAFANQKLYEFSRQLEYKLAKIQSKLIKADKWFASSQICNCCGYKYNREDYDGVHWNLRIREWTCFRCKTKHDRDENASQNLRKYGLAV